VGDGDEVREGRDVGSLGPTAMRARAAVVVVDPLSNAWSSGDLSQACRQNGGAREREGQQPVTKPGAAVVAGRSRTRVSPLALAHEGLQAGWKE
jgi:hypothetical protein